MYTPFHVGTIELSNGNMTAHSSGGGNSYALLNRGFEGTGKYSWTVRVDVDNAGDEMTCIGAAMKPVTDASYEHSNELVRKWVYYIYNSLPYF